MQTLVDKEAFAHAAAAHGVPAPRLLEPQQLPDISDDDLPHFFIKPRDSQLFSDRFGVKAFTPMDRARTEEMLGLLAAERIEVVLQELIPSPPTTFWTVTSIGAARFVRVSPAAVYGCIRAHSATARCP